MKLVLTGIRSRGLRHTTSVFAASELTRPHWFTTLKDDFITSRFVWFDHRVTCNILLIVFLWELFQSVALKIEDFAFQPCFVYKSTWLCRSSRPLKRKYVFVPVLSSPVFCSRSSAPLEGNYFYGFISWTYFVRRFVECCRKRKATFDNVYLVKASVCGEFADLRRLLDCVTEKLPVVYLLSKNLLDASEIRMMFR